MRGKASEQGLGFDSMALLLLAFIHAPATGRQTECHGLQLKLNS